MNWHSNYYYIQVHKRLKLEMSYNWAVPILLGIYAKGSKSQRYCPVHDHYCTIYYRQDVETVVMPMSRGMHKPW